jgi:hypothetical protein
VTYFITYQSSRHESRILEWVVPESWSPATIAAHFEQQFPGAEILHMEPQL